MPIRLTGRNLTREEGQAPPQVQQDLERPTATQIYAQVAKNAEKALVSQRSGVSRLRVSSAESGLAMIAFPHHAFGDGAGQQRIGGNRRDDQRAFDSLLPERRHVQHDERDADHAEHERAESCAEYRADAARDRRRELRRVSCRRRP